MDERPAAAAAVVTRTPRLQPPATSAAHVPQPCRGLWCPFVPGPTALAGARIAPPDRPSCPTQSPTDCSSSSLAVMHAAPSKRAQLLAERTAPATGSPLESPAAIHEALVRQYTRLHLQYVRLYISITDRVSAVDASKASPDRAHAGLLVPTALSPLA